MKLALLANTNSELHDVVEHYLFNADREDYSTEEYQEAYEDIHVDEIPEFYNMYHVYTTDKRYLDDYIKIAKSVDKYMIMVVQTIADECVVCLDENLQTVRVIYPDHEIVQHVRREWGNPLSLRQQGWLLSYKQVGANLLCLRQQVRKNFKKICSTYFNAMSVCYNVIVVKYRAQKCRKGETMKVMYKLYQLGCRIKNEEEMDIIEWIITQMAKENI